MYNIYIILFVSVYLSVSSSFSLSLSQTHKQNIKQKFVIHLKNIRIRGPLGGPTTLRAPHNIRGPLGGPWCSSGAPETLIQIRGPLGPPIDRTAPGAPPTDVKRGPQGSRHPTDQGPPRNP